MEAGIIMKRYISYYSTNKNTQAGDLEMAEFDHPKMDIGFILDCGYFSKNNIDYMDACGYFVIVTQG
jgi:hypothetical protein